MPNTRDIRRRIKSVKNTAQITKAMQLVAAAKMKKAQDQAIAGRRYAEVMNRVLVDLTANCDDDAHPLLSANENGHELMVVMSTDKGLCGGLNTNLMRRVTDEATDEAAYVTIGNKGRGVLARGKKELIADFHIGDPVAFTEVKQLSKFVTDKFASGEANTVRVAFANFVNTMTQEPHISTLLPVAPSQMVTKRKFEKRKEGVPETAAEAMKPGGYLFEPSAAGVLDAMIPHYINYQLYQMVLEARASEHSARMVAMKSATDNAEGMIKDLTLEYNKVRQAAITSELLEITTAQMALG